MEQIEFNLLFRWFVGLGMDDPVWDASTFCHNRDRLLEAWASMKSFRPKGGGAGRNAERDFHDEKRSNETHESTTDADARLYRKGNGRESRLCFMGHALMENRNGLVVGGNVTIASGTAEREAALELIDRHCPGKRRRTLGADKAHDVTAFVNDLRRRKVTPSDEVDQAWHLHLLYSETYLNVFCADTLDYPLHHGPTKGGGSEDRKFQNWYERTKS